jgi:hypothetical protein
MGEYTTNLKLYKPDANEFVDEDVQLNRNWDILDVNLRRLLEYEYTTDAVPNVTNSVSRPKFYKAYSNSIQTYFKIGNFFWQGPSNPVNSWATAKSWLASGWTENPDLPLYVRSIRRTSGVVNSEVEWAGAIWMGGSSIPIGTTEIVIPDGGIPSAYRPARTQYFTMWGGNTSTVYSVARILISSAGRMEIRRYGISPSAGSNENRIELTGIKYDDNVTG